MADGFTRVAPEALTGAFTPTVLIAALDAARREAEAMPPPPPPGPDPDEISALIEQARRAGHAEGHAAGLAAAAAARETEATRAAVLAAEALAAAREEAREAAEEMATGLARLAIAMMDAALPGLAAENGAALAAAFARRLAPVLEAAPEPMLAVAPGLAEEVQALLGATRFEILEDPALAPGDARAAWRGGAASFDLSARRQEIRRVLESAGLGPKE
jgi:flagellar biosynthesis/type III secretory pathway protein FliH